MTAHDLGDLAAVPENGSKAFTVGDVAVLVCRTSAGVFAVENMCSHALAALEGGKVKGPHIFCPLHGVRFDLRTGAPNGTLTKKPIRTFPLEVKEGAIWVSLPG